METDETPPPVPRSLDIASTATVDLMALNNKIVSMRGPVKKVKVQVIHKLTRNIQSLQKKKKGSEEKFQRKRERFLEDIKVIKHLKPDKISKFVLGNTKSLNDICKMPDCTAENRSLVRLSEHKILQDIVKKFRTEHEDWKSLSAFLLSRNSGRRYKKKKTNKVEKMITNVRAGEVLVKSFLEGRFKGKCPEGGNLSETERLKGLVPDHLRRDVKDKDEEDSDNSQTKPHKSVSEKVKKSQSLTKERGKSQNDEDSDHNISEDAEGDSDEEDANDDESEENKEESSSDENLEEENKIITSERLSSIKEDDNADDEDSDDEEENDSIDEENITEGNVLSSVRTKVKLKTLPDNEVVVKKINLDHLSENIDSQIETTIPHILTKNFSNIDHKKASKKRKDAFFVMSDCSDESDIEDKVDEKEDEDDDKDVSSDEERQLGRGMRAFHSTFMGSLSEKKWRKTAEKRREKDPNSHKNLKKDFSKGKQGYRKDNRFEKKERNTRGNKEDGKSFTNNRPPSKTTSLKESANQAKKAETLHPSWLASKKRKQQVQIQAFQGKKITFDDDD